MGAIASIRMGDSVPCESAATRLCRATSAWLAFAVCTAAVLGWGSSGNKHAAALKQLTPPEAAALVKSFRRECAAGRVLIRYTSPTVHGEMNEKRLCVERAHAYYFVRRDLHCPQGSRVVIDFTRHVASCNQSIFIPNAINLNQK